MPKNKTGGPKQFLQMIAVLAVLIVMIGTGVSVYLVRNQNTDDRSQASGANCGSYGSQPACEDAMSLSCSWVPGNPTYRPCNQNECNSNQGNCSNVPVFSSCSAKRQNNQVDVEYCQGLNATSCNTVRCNKNYSQQCTGQVLVSIGGTCVGNNSNNPPVNPPNNPPNNPPVNPPNNPPNNPPVNPPNSPPNPPVNPPNNPPVNNPPAQTFIGCTNSKMYQTYWRGSASNPEAWYRTVNVISNVPQWSSAPAFQRAGDANSLLNGAGSGEILAAADIMRKDLKRTEQYIVRKQNSGNKTFTVWKRTFGVKLDGHVDFTTVTPWENVTESNEYTKNINSSETLTGFGGFMQSNMFGNGTRTRSLSAVVGTKLWAGQYILPTHPAIVNQMQPGNFISGVQTFDEYISPDERMLYQAYYAGNKGYVRQMPINQNGIIVTSQVTPWAMVVDLASNPGLLPGSGDMIASSSYMTCGR